MMFELYTEEVKLKDPSGKEETYRLRPLTGRYLPKLYSIISKLHNDDGSEDIDVSNFDEKTIADMHTIVFETFKRSYPNEDETKLDEFVSQNLMKLVGPVFGLNIKS